jgi:hypothetical protein
MNNKSFNEPRRTRPDRRQLGRADRRVGPRRVAPDHFHNKNSSLSPHHIWGATGFILLVLAGGLIERSSGVISNLFMERSDTELVASPRLNDLANFETAAGPATIATNKKITLGSAHRSSKARLFNKRVLPPVDTSSCPPLPKVPWWNNLSHQKIISFVAQHHDGNWSTYLEKWDQQAEKIADINRRGSAIRLTKNKIMVDGRKLTEYAKQVAERATINHCLANL